MLAGSREGGAAVAAASRAPCDVPPRRMPVSGWGLWPLQTASSSSASSSRPSTPSPPSPYEAPPSAAPPSTPPDSSLFRAAKLAGTAHALGVTPPPSQPPPPHTSSAGRSRNDIFSAASPSLTPAPRPSPASAGGGVHASPASVASKNSLFFGASPVAAASRSTALLSPTASPSPAPAPGAAHSPPRRLAEQDAVAGPSSSLERPSYGRSSTEERERERDRIRKSKDMDFRLCPTRDYLLGEGRHCNVFLGSYRLKRQQRRQRSRRASPDSSDVGEEEAADESSEWQLCAVKRLHADRQSQLLGLDEAFALRRLGPHPNIVSLIDIRDEVELPAPTSLPGASGATWASMPHDAPLPAASPAALGRGVPPSSRNGAVTLGGSAHARSSSTAHSRADLGLREPTAAPAAHTSDAAHALALHRRLASQPSGPSQLLPEVRVAGPDEDGVGPLAHRSPSPAQSVPECTTPSPSGTPADPPRLLILLELLPHSLRSFARRNPERIGWLRWKTWALQLAGTVEWMHRRGCVHVDIKPENILLTDTLDLKLCDFNSALFPSPSSPLLDGAGLGTPAYGAPELTRGAAPAAGAAGFSYPVDVWSMGAVLYSLATGVEPFARSRSMIDMLYRKRVFFESEENDRVARLSVAEGWGGGGSNNGGSASASRSGSLRGRRSVKPEAARPTARREGSTDSIESVASSILVDNGRTGASVRSIAMLLDDAPFKGLLSTPAGATQPAVLLDAERNGTASAAAAGHQRRASMGKTPQKLGRAAYLNAPRRPAAALRRTTSYGDQSSSSDASPQPTDDAGGSSGGGATQGVKAGNTPAGAGGGVTRSADSQLAPSALSPPHSPPPPSAAARSGGMYNTPSGLRLAVTAAFAQASRRAAVQQQQQQQQAQTQTQQQPGLASSAQLQLDELQHEEEEEDLRPYRDGSPALILPGGGRLPDAARALLERMLATDPALRPTAAQVVAALSAL